LSYRDFYHVTRRPGIVRFQANSAFSFSKTRPLTAKRAAPGSSPMPSPERAGHEPPLARVYGEVSGSSLEV